MVQVTDLTEEEQNISRLLISIICLYGNDGLPLEKVDDEYKLYVGSSIPFRRLGYRNLRSFVATLPEIYIVRDDENNEVLIEQSTKSMHIKQLILRQKKSNSNKRKTSDWPSRSFTSKKLRVAPVKNYRSILLNDSSIDEEQQQEFQKVESMLPLFYNHQALGDDFFVDIADTKLGYYVPDEEEKKCGLCCVGQTISELTEKVKNSTYMAPRVVVMIGFQDLLQGTNVNKMLTDLRKLVTELTLRKKKITLLTLIPSPKLPENQQLQTRMDIYNNAISDYAYESEFNCQIIDMNSYFEEEAQAFQRDCGRLNKVARKDPYKVFSDYGRKIFLATLRTCLRNQLEQ